MHRGGEGFQDPHRHHPRLASALDGVRLALVALLAQRLRSLTQLYQIIGADVSFGVIASDLGAAVN